MFDPELYREKREVQQWLERCPIATYTATLRARGAVDDAALTEIETAVAGEIEAAVAFAEAGTWEPIESLTRWVVSEGAVP
jgi:TPP-dependent pyruvate/acetoin dehydrogenase alpha subunit